MVITTKVAPTQIAETTIPAKPESASGAATPAAITRCPTIHTPLSPRRRTKGVTATVEIAAAAPNTGQAQP